jgi:hypothetical protein
MLSKRFFPGIYEDAHKQATLFERAIICLQKQTNDILLFSPLKLYLKVRSLNFNFHTVNNA